MGIGLTREEYDEQMAIMQDAIDTIIEIAETDLCHQAGSCHDIAYNFLKRYQWWTDIDPDRDIRWP